jgi:hypothetical protein
MRATPQSASGARLASASGLTQQALSQLAQRPVETADCSRSPQRVCERAAVLVRQQVHEFRRVNAGYMLGSHSGVVDHQAPFAPACVTTVPGSAVTCDLMYQVDTGRSGCRRGHTS